MSKKNDNKKKSNKQSYIKPGLYALLVLVVLIIFGKTTSYDFTIDDKIIIVENSYVKSGLSSFPKLINAALENDMSEPGVTRPLPMFTHALEVSLFGIKAGPQHMVNILLYILLSILIFYLLNNYLLKDKKNYISFFITLLFLVHPVHVESVANIKGRDDILSFIFGVLSIILFFRNLEKKSLMKEILIFTSLTLSFMSKETGILFTGFIGISFYFFTDANPKQAFKSTYKYLILGIILLLLRFGLFTPPPKYINIYNNSLLALNSPVKQFFMSWRIFLHYIQLMFWPDPLVWDYSLGHFEYNENTRFLGIVSIIIYLGLTTIALIMLKKKNPIGYGLLFFLLTLFPVSNIVIKIASTFGERLLFIPSFGIIVGFVFFIIWFSKKFIPFKYFSQIIFLIIVLIFSFMSSQRTEAWKNDQVLVLNDFENTHSIRSLKAYIQYTTSEKKDIVKNHIQALKVCKEGNKRFPNDWELWYFNGVINSTLKNIEDAKKAYAKSLEIKDDSFVCLVNYANLFLEDNPDKSIELLKKAVDVKSDNAKIIGNLAILLHKRGDLQEAKINYEKAISLGTRDSNIINAYQILKKDLEIE